jgi:plastocyanin
VSIGDNFFFPPFLTISQGDRVCWINNGVVEHKSHSVNPYWDSGRLEPGQSYARTFNTPGEFDYYDPLHTQATGIISVISSGMEDTWGRIKALY